MRCSWFVCFQYQYELMDLNLLDVFQFIAGAVWPAGASSSWLLSSFAMTSVVFDSFLAFS